MRIFLDANILFSAVKSDGAVHAFVAMLLDVGGTHFLPGIAEAAVDVGQDVGDFLVAQVPGRHGAAETPRGLG